MGEGDTGNFKRSVGSHPSLMAEGPMLARTLLASIIMCVLMEAVAMQKNV